MRKDVRLGLAIGGSAIVIVACSVLFFRNPEPKPAPQASQNPPAAPEIAAGGPAGHGDVPDPSAGAGTGAASTGTGAGGIGQGTVSVGPSDLHGMGSTGAATPGSTGTDAAAGTGTALGGGTGTATGTGTGTSEAMGAGTGTGSNWQDLLEHGGGSITRTTTPGAGGHNATGTDIAIGGSATPGGTGLGGNSSGTAVAPPVSGGPRTYTVVPGDTYWTIAQKEYGNGAYYSHVMRANPSVPANRLKAGVAIRIPGKAEVVPAGAPPVAAGTPATVDAKSQYRVQHGDNLYTICKKLYGKTDKVSKLYQLNKDLIGPNPSALKLNMVLQLPDAPAGEAGTSVGTIQ